MKESNLYKIGSTTSTEWITTDTRNTPSTTNPEEEEIVDAPGKDGNASMPKKAKRPNPWRKMVMMMGIWCHNKTQMGVNKRLH